MATMLMAILRDVVQSQEAKEFKSLVVLRVGDDERRDVITRERYLRLARRVRNCVQETGECDMSRPIKEDC